jgi:phosphatidylinositol-3-phosphatase
VKLAALALVTVASATATTPRVPAFSHVVVIVFENKERSSVIATRAAPTFTRYSRTGADLRRYYAAAHPSLPNYLALVSGSTHGITSDCTDCVVDARNLADTLEEHGLTWKTYAEGLPRDGFTGAFAGRYAKKHDPFLYFRDVVDDVERLRRVVPLTRFGRDLAAHDLPRFSLVVPDLCHDMHDCSVATGDRWLKSFLPPLLHSWDLRGGVVFVVFDEGATSARGGGRVAAFAVGPAVRPHSRFVSTTGHYGLLRTIEEGWGLPPLARSANASPITGIWRLTQ